MQRYRKPSGKLTWPWNKIHHLRMKFFPSNKNLPFVRGFPRGPAVSPANFSDSGSTEVRTCALELQLSGSCIRISHI